jgi:hypothetical protein
MGAYKEEFPVGSAVKIVDTIELEEFARSWKYHHPLQREQMDFAGKTTKVEGVAFYHGGDALYRLLGLPGYWHEQCLAAATKL